MKKFKLLDNNISSNIKKTIIIIFFIYAFSLTSIIRANFNYIDDLGRIIEGKGAWEFFSRYTSNFLASIIHAGQFLTDISPLPQLIACFFLAIASGILIYTFSKKDKFSFWNIIAVIPLGLSPYFLECLSYKFDAPYMALSILSSCFPILFVNDKKLKFSLITIFCTLIMCTTYQASSGIFPMLIIFYCFYNWNIGKKNNKDLLTILVSSFVSYFIGLIIFKLFIMRNVDSYVSTSLASLNNLIPNFFSNIIKYYKYVIADFRKIWLLFIILMLILFIIISTINSKQRKYISIIVSIFTLFICSLIAFGIYPFLTNTLFEPRAMYGFGVFLAIVAINISITNNFLISKLPFILLSWSFIIFTFTYGNALQEQKRYTDFRIQLLISDLNSLEIMNNDNIKKIQIEGNIGRSPVINRMPHNILHRLIPDTFAGGEWIWSKYYFNNYFGLKQIYISTNENLRRLPVLKNTMYHKIKGNDEYLLITLKE